jgi:hypothetical protein
MALGHYSGSIPDNRQNPKQKLNAMKTQDPIKQEIRLLNRLLAIYRKAKKSEYYVECLDTMENPEIRNNSLIDDATKSGIYQLYNSVSGGLCRALRIATLGEKMFSDMPVFKASFTIKCNEWRWERGLLTPRIEAMESVLKRLKATQNEKD